MHNMNQIVGTHNIIWIILDTLRYDVAQNAFHQGALPVLSQYLPQNGWEKRHTPSTFTYAAHHAFFAGFLPTPARPGRHRRLFASQFTGSTSTSTSTFIFPQATVVEALAAQNYRTVCIGGVGFFNPENALGTILPGLFQEKHWSPGIGPGNKHSAIRQVAKACSIINNTDKRLFLFINVPAIHSPNNMYLPDTHPDHRKLNSLAGQGMALKAVDMALAPLFETAKVRGPTFVMICSDHGTAFGEDGYQGHRVAHETVWNVPYTDFVIKK